MPGLKKQRRKSMSVEIKRKVKIETQIREAVPNGTAELTVRGSNPRNAAKLTAPSRPQRFAVVGEGV